MECRAAQEDREGEAAEAGGGREKTASGPSLPEVPQVRHGPDRDRLQDDQGGQVLWVRGGVARRRGDRGGVKDGKIGGRQDLRAVQPLAQRLVNKLEMQSDSAPRG